MRSDTVMFDANDERRNSILVFAEDGLSSRSIELEDRSYVWKVMDFLLLI